MSKQQRILKTQRTQSSLTPYCYYHRNQHITHFCTETNCTLPLCKQCQNIHLEEYPEHSIVLFERAKQIATIQITQLISPLRNIDETLRTYKQKLLQIIDEHLQSLKVHLLQNTKIAKPKFTSQQLQQKIQKINNGSIRTLIQYYSNPQLYQTPILQTFNMYHINQQTIKQMILDNFSINQCKNIQANQFYVEDIYNIKTVKKLPQNDNICQQRQKSLTKQKSQISSKLKLPMNKQINVKLNNKDYLNKQQKIQNIIDKTQSPTKGLRLSMVFDKKDKDNNEQFDKRSEISKVSKVTNKSWRNVIITKDANKNSSTSRLLLENSTNQFNQYNLLTPNQMKNICETKRANTGKKNISNSVYTSQYMNNAFPNSIIMNSVNNMAPVRQFQL